MSAFRDTENTVHETLHIWPSAVNARTKLSQHLMCLYLFNSPFGQSKKSCQSVWLAQGQDGEGWGGRVVIAASLRCSESLIRSWCSDWADCGVIMFWLVWSLSCLSVWIRDEKAGGYGDVSFSRAPVRGSRGIRDSLYSMDLVFWEDCLIYFIEDFDLF